MKFISCAYLLFATTVFAANVPLNDDWQFRLDPNGVGVRQNWFETKLSGTARLPGSLDEQGLGVKSTATLNDAMVLLKKPELRTTATTGNKEYTILNRLTKEYEYVGAAWYQKEVDIPEDWAGKCIILFLERCKWEVQVWVDNHYAGVQNSLCVAQEFDLSELLTPGKHRITLCVDNTIKIWLGHHPGHPTLMWAHSLTDETQTNWNGIIGTMELRVKEPVWIKSLQAYPDFKQKVVHVAAKLGNRTGKKIAGQLQLSCMPAGGLKTAVQKVEGDGKEFTTSVDMPFDGNQQLWDEFSPALYQLTAELVVDSGAILKDQKTISFGLRDFRSKDKHFTLNGRKIFLRGNVENCIFPLTGYPSMDIGEWKRIIQIAKSYGFNHFRFHSWCPPEAAFVAADELGFYFQIEAPLWEGHGNVGDESNRAAWLIGEVDRIVDTYGNHPSFMLMSMNNESALDKEHYLQFLVEHLRKRDPRHLYTCGTHPMVLDRNDDYFVSAWADKGTVRGLGRPDGKCPAPDFDFDSFFGAVDRPFITHELGQYVVYPNYTEIPKYTGHLKPYNLMAYRDLLAERKMSDQAAQFNLASGRFALVLCKEEVETQLRTSAISGFDLLDIQDYPGQGTALIGWLDAFWDSKGITTPQEVRQWCSETVPLARFAKRVWLNSETFTARAQIAHYGPGAIEKAQPKWTITDTKGSILAHGQFNDANIPTGGLTEVGKLEFRLSDISAAVQLRLEVALVGPEVKNAWYFWVYPQTLDSSEPSGVVVAREWNQQTRKALVKGATVVFLPGKGALKNTINTSFYSLFWSSHLFPQKATLGICCDPKHPALAKFPTEAHTDWQWYELLEPSEALVLNGTPPELRPIVQFVPDFVKNDKLGAVVELKSGKGKLLVCTLDIDTDLDKRPAARQLRSSLFNYVTSPAFNPKYEMSADDLDTFLLTWPADQLRGAPPEATNAVLNIQAATHIDILNTPHPWKKETDEITICKPGFDYLVDGSSYRDAQAGQWFADKMKITVSCPKDFIGTLYVHFQDVGNQGRKAALYFDGRDLGALSECRGNGVWLKLPVTKAESMDGEFTLLAHCSGGPNVTVTGLLLLPEDNSSR